MKWKAGIILLLISSVLTVSFTGCVHAEEDYAFLISEELFKADTKFDIARDAIEKGDYAVAIQKSYDARSHIDTAYRYYREGEELFTDKEKVNYKTIFEIYRDVYALTIGTAKLERASTELGQKLEKVVDERTALLVLPEMEIFARSLRESAKDWNRFADKYDFVIRTNPAVTEYLDLRPEDVGEYREIATTLDKDAQDFESSIQEFRTIFAPGYVPFREMVIPKIIEVPAVSPEIIPPDLARFFGGFDVDRNGEIDLGEAEEFFYWVEANIIYRWDDEEAHIRPGFVPGSPVGDGRPGDDYWQTPYETWTERAGDCEDMAILQVIFYNHFGISAHNALVAVKVPGEVDHAIAITLMGRTPEEFADFLGGLVYYEFEDGYYMLVDNAYSDVFGYLNGGLKEGQFIIHYILTLEESFEMHRHIREAM